MKTLIESFEGFLLDESGLETVEYAVITALMVAVIGTAIGARFDAARTIIEGVP